MNNCLGNSACVASGTEGLKVGINIFALIHNMGIKAYFLDLNGHEAVNIYKMLTTTAQKLPDNILTRGQTKHRYSGKNGADNVRKTLQEMNRVCLSTDDNFKRYECFGIGLTVNIWIC